MTSRDSKKDRLSALFLAAFLLACVAQTASAQSNVTQSDTISISVTVSDKTLVDITPTSLTFSSMDPGANSSEQAIQVENIGSTNISYLWFNTTYPADSPFGTGDPTEYDAGNFVVVRQNSSGSDLFAVDRWEYNETELIYLTAPASSISHGRFRQANAEYFWYLADDGGVCNTTSTTFSIGKTPHNQSAQGSVVFTSCDSLTDIAGGNPCRAGVLEGEDSQWGWADVVVGVNGDPRNYSVAVSGDCTTVRFYKWNMDAPGASDSSNDYAAYFRDNASVLAPGANTIANVNVYVPYGTAAGTVTQGTLTVIAMAVDVGG